jgi:putative ABC transport system permease protein
MQAPNTTGIAADENLQLMDQILGHIHEHPGVLTAAHATQAPWDPQTTLLSRTFRVEDGDERGVPSPMSQLNSVSPLYFQTVGVAVVRGRAFLPTDDETSERVAILNERMATDLFGGADPVGRRFARQNFDGTWSDWVRVVGVAADTREYGLALAGTHTVYQPAAQSSAGQSLLVRTTGEPGRLYARVREVVGGLDADRPVDNFATLAALRADDIAPQRLNATLFSAFALLALVVAAVGVLGVLAFTVSQRTQEFGVRMALGAQQGQVLASVLREAAVMTVAALAAGVVAAYGFSRFLSGFLFGVGPTDAATYAGVAALLAAVALVAAYVPARRATRVDPMKALRSE